MTIKKGTFFRDNKNARAHARGLATEISQAIKDYLDFKNDLTYEQTCELSDLRRAMNILGLLERDEDL